MKRFCPENFLFDLQQTLNQTIVLDPDVPPDSDLEILAETFLVVLNKHAPLCNVSRKRKKIFKIPWMTRALLKSIITKNKLYSKVWNKKVHLNMMHISNTEMHFTDQSKLQNKTIMNSKSYYARMTQKSFGKLYTAYWKLTLKANLQ